MLETYPTSPAVSIVTSTFNRSNVLSLSVQSVIDQTFTDWELWVIGDACTDDTSEVMHEFSKHDCRIHYYNRDSNFGEQSGPNNDGVARSSGRYIAYLNHDDIWLKDHLQLAIDAIEKNQVDMVFTLAEVVDPDGSVRITGATPKGYYDPLLFTGASCWLVRRSTIEEIGPWRASNSIYNMPSQDWCYRAWKAGKKILMVSALSVVAIPSGRRRDAYRNREYEINRQYLERSRDPLRFRCDELTRLVIMHPEQWLKRYDHWTLLKWSVINLVRRWFVSLGYHPEAAKNFLRYLRKGGFIRKLRKTRGLN